MHVFFMIIGVVFVILGGWALSRDVEFWAGIFLVNGITMIAAAGIVSEIR